MNKQRKNEIRMVIEKINSVNFELKKILDDEEDYYNNIPENLQSSSRADDSSDAIDELNDAINEIEEAIECLKNI